MQIFVLNIFNEVSSSWGISIHAILTTDFERVLALGRATFQWALGFKVTTTTTTDMHMSEALHRCSSLDASKQVMKPACDSFLDNSLKVQPNFIPHDVWHWETKIQARRYRSPICRKPSSINMDKHFVDHHKIYYPL